MRLGAAKTAREWAKSPDEFEAPGVEPVFLKQVRQSIMPRAAQAFAAVRFVFSIQGAKSNASLCSTRRIENCDAIHPDKYMASSSRSLSRNRTAFSAL